MSNTNKLISIHTIYTEELLNSLKQKFEGLDRAKRIKLMITELSICERQARRVYHKYFENNVTISQKEKNAIRAAEALKRLEVLSETEIAAPRSIKRLYWDIETSPNLGFFWRAGWDLNVGTEAITSERKIICIGYKWEDEAEAHVLHWDENQDDKALLVKFLEIANEADELIAHNGDKFDMPWFRTRCLFHGLGALPNYKTIDSCSIARRKFYFNSNKLDYIAGFFGLGHKFKTGIDLWKDIVFKKCPVAMEKMCDYCKQDVVLLQQVWEKLRVAIPSKTHAGVLNGSAKWTCPYDGSENVRLNSRKVTSGGSLQYQMQCQDCGRYYTINMAAYKAYLESKQG